MNLNGYNMKTCPICKGNDIIMFDSDNDKCNDCGGWFPDIKDELSDLIESIQGILGTASKKYGAPLKIIIDSRGEQYAFVAYGSDRKQFSIEDISELSRQ